MQKVPAGPPRRGVAAADALTHGITVGCDDDSFCAGQPVTRKHFVVFLWRAAGQPEPSHGQRRPLLTVADQVP